MKLFLRILLTMSLLISYGASLAQDDISAVFDEMLPEVSYSADRRISMTMGTQQQVMDGRVVYIPRKEWSTTSLPQMSGMEIVTVNDYDAGVVYSTVAGMTQHSSIEIPKSLAAGGGDNGISSRGQETIDGVRYSVFDYTLAQTEGDQKFTATGVLFLDTDGIPRRVETDIVMDNGQTMSMSQTLSNVVVGPQDESLFADAGGSNPDGNNPYEAMIAAAQQYESQASTQGSGTVNPLKVTGQVPDWPGGRGRIVADSGVVFGSIADSGALSITADAAPAGGIFPIDSGYACNGGTLSDRSASYQIRGVGLTVVNDSSQPVGRLIPASSFDVASWWASPTNNAAVPGHTVRFVYVDRPVRSTGTCTTMSETQERKLDFETGWNIEKTSIAAIGDSPFFEPDQPTRTVWETVDTFPANTTWIFESFSPEQQQALKNSAELPDPVEEVVEFAKEAAEEEAKMEARDKIRKGIGKLFGK